MPSDLRPFPKPGEQLASDPAPGVLERAFELGLGPREKIALVVWFASLFATSLAATLVIVHHAVSVTGHNVSNSYLLGWGMATGGTLLLLAVLGGLFAFAGDAAWHVIVLLAMAGGLPVAVGYWFGVSGQMESGSALCGSGEPCDLSWGFGAAALAVAAALVLAVVVGAAFGIKKLASRT